MLMETQCIRNDHDDGEEDMVLELRRTVCEALRHLARSEISFVRAVEKSATEIENQNLETQFHICDQLGIISDEELLALLAERIFLEVLWRVCETKVDALRLRLWTVKQRFKQKVCDSYDLQDDENIAVDLVTMQIIKESEKEKVRKMRNDVYELIEADEAELLHLTDSEGESTFERSLAAELLSERRDAAIDIIRALFESNEQDTEFLKLVSSDSKISKPIRKIASHFLKKKGDQPWKMPAVLEWI